MGPVRCVGEISLLIIWSRGEPQGSLSGLKTLLAGGDLSPRHRQIRSLAGAANLSNDNAGVLR